MATNTLSKPEIVAELLEIKAEQKRLCDRETELLTLLQNPKKATKNHAPLTFGENIITWDGGALAIRGKGYAVMKILYTAKKMRMREATLCPLVWSDGDSADNHSNFKELLRWLSEKLEKAKCPYRILPVMRREKVETTGEIRNGKPVKKRIRSGIIGVKLRARK
jgi:uncharacterized protein Usg